MEGLKILSAELIWAIHPINLLVFYDMKVTVFNFLGKKLEVDIDFEHQKDKSHPISGLEIAII